MGSEALTDCADLRAVKVAVLGSGKLQLTQANAVGPAEPTEAGLFM